MKLLNSLLPRF